MHRKNLKLVFITLLISVFILTPLKIDAKSTKNILFISSYSPSFITFNQQLKALYNEFAKSKFNYDLQIEYMDVKNFRSKDVEDNFYNLLNFKLKSYNKFDAILLADDAALEFGLKYKNDLKLDIPIVFFGVTEENNIQLAKESGLSGVVEYSSISDNMHFINSIYKDTNKNIILLAGNATNITKYKREIDEFYSFENKFKNFNFQFIPMPIEITEDFEKKLSNIDKDNDIVLFVYPYRDGSGKSISVEESIDLINDNIDAPVFTSLIYDLSKNMIGGKVISPKNQATLGAKLVDDILSGKIKNQAFINSNFANLWMFNYENLKIHGISEKQLPLNSIIVNKPIPFFIEHKERVIPFLFTLFGLLLIILALIIHTVKSAKHKKELRKAKRIAEDANESKNNFIATISHELRTPVAVISSANQLLEVLLSKENIKNSQGIKNNSNIITQNSNRLLRLINNIIDIAKIDSGFTDLKLRNVDIILLIEDTVLSVIPYAQSKDLNIVFDTNTEELFMSVDPEKIERIVLNLLSNAIKFSKPNGDIFATIITGKDNISFTVQDDGIGIDEDNLSKIFDKFMQIDNGFTRQNEGSGIGLSIVKSFVKLHNGSINVNSKLGEGATFFVNLPINSDLDNNIINDIPSVDNNTSIELSDIYK